MPKTSNARLDYQVLLKLIGNNRAYLKRWNDNLTSASPKPIKSPTCIKVQFVLEGTLYDADDLHSILIYSNIKYVQVDKVSNTTLFTFNGYSIYAVVYYITIGKKLRKKPLLMNNARWFD